MIVPEAKMKLVYEFVHACPDVGLADALMHLVVAYERQAATIERLKERLARTVQNGKGLTS